MIIRNRIKCAYCDVVLESTHRHDFVAHVCEHGPQRPEVRWNADCTKLEETGKTVGPYIAADGGTDYLRRLGNREDWIEDSEIFHPIIP